jgi:hypothetical protein
MKRMALALIPAITLIVTTGAPDAAARIMMNGGHARGQSQESRGLNVAPDTGTPKLGQQGNEPHQNPGTGRPQFDHHRGAEHGHRHFDQFGAEHHFPHFHRHGSHRRDGAIVGIPFWSPPLYPEQNAPLYMQPGTVYVQPGTDYGYYCPDADEYYPYIQECPGGWIQVPPGGLPP